MLHILSKTSKHLRGAEVRVPCVGPRPPHQLRRELPREQADPHGQHGRSEGARALRQGIRHLQFLDACVASAYVPYSLTH